MSIIIIEKSTGNAVAELWDKELAKKINREKYYSLPILVYLQRLNQTIKGNHNVNI